MGTSRARDEAGRSPTDADRLARVEAWFVRRGVPQLVEGYSTESRVDARAAPWLVAWVVVGTVLWWGVRPGASVPANLGGIAATLAGVAAGLTVLRWMRRRVMWWVDRRLEVLDVFAVGVLVAVSSAVLEQSGLQGLTDGGQVLLGITAIYAVVGLGLWAIAWWSLRRLVAELARITGLLARTLPVLLILVLFLLFAAELWEAAHLLGAGETAVVLGLMLVVAAVLVLTTFRAELRVIEARGWEEHRSRVAGTPAADLTATAPTRAVEPLRFGQRLNLAVLVLIGQLIQSAFVALLVAGFLLVVGLVALPVEIQERWVGGSVSALVGVDAPGESRVLTVELLTVVVLLGGVVGLYFTGLAITDSAFRTSHFERLLDEVSLLVAARAVYAAARAGGRERTAETEGPSRAEA